MSSVYRSMNYNMLMKAMQHIQVCAEARNQALSAIMNAIIYQVLNVYLCEYLLTDFRCIGIIDYILS